MQQNYILLKYKHIITYDEATKLYPFGTHG